MKQISVFMGMVLFLLGFTSCNSLEETTFPKVMDVTELNSTDFVTTFETPFDTKKNILYSATMPFVWNEIKNKVGPEVSDFTSKELEALNKTESHIDVLKENEYQISIEIEGTEIASKAYFKQSLPFFEPLTKFEELLKFDNANVEAFGFEGNNTVANINYFNNEKDFSLSLFPKNEEYEIILIMNQSTDNSLLSFNQYFEIYNKQTQLEKNQNTVFNNYDIVKIPIIEFNLEKNFNNIAGSSFKTETVTYNIIKTYQKNSFILNEKGAEVESGSEMIAYATSDETNEPKPKRMIFNKPFVILLKRQDAINPYFGIYVANHELLKKG